jgi:hypothetical protein
MSNDQEETDYNFRKYLESYGFDNLPPLQVMREMDAEVITFSKSNTRDYIVIIANMDQLPKNGDLLA